MPYDLTDETGAEHPAAAASGQNQPTGRASDILLQKQGVASKAAVAENLPFIICDRPITPADGFVKSVCFFALVVTLIGLCYLLWGVWSGALANPHFQTAFDHANRHRVLDNLTFVSNVVRLSTSAVLVSLLFLYYDIAGVGYLLILTAVLLNFGIPWLSEVFLGMTHSDASVATLQVMGFLNHLSWLPGVPGFLLIALDVARRSITGLQTAKVRRASLKFGRHVATHAKRRNVFLGYCWNMPYCREAIREKCPIHIQHKGPCWRHKRGCMCEETIAVIATTSGDWKKAVAGAVDKIEGRKPPEMEAKSGNPLLGFSDGSGKHILSWEEKKQRCRECVIYNTHQEQKYKAAVGVVFGATALTIWLANGVLIGTVSIIYRTLNSALGHFSLSSSSSDVLMTSASVPVSWFILSVVTILLISKLLQLVEYLCFTLKI